MGMEIKYNIWVGGAQDKEVSAGRNRSAPLTHDTLERPAIIEKTGTRYPYRFIAIQMTPIAQTRNLNLQRIDNVDSNGPQHVGTPITRKNSAVRIRTSTCETFGVAKLRSCGKLQTYEPHGNPSGDSEGHRRAPGFNFEPGGSKRATIAALCGLKESEAFGRKGIDQPRFDRFGGGDDKTGTEREDKGTGGRDGATASPPKESRLL